MGSIDSDVLKQVPIDLIIDNVQSGLCLLEVDDTIRYLYANDGYFRMLGYSKDEFLETASHHTEQLFLTENIKKNHAAMHHAVETGETVELEYLVYAKDGTSQYHHMKGIPVVHPERKTTLLLTIITDVTERETTKRSIEKQYKRAQRLYKREMRYLEGLSDEILYALKANMSTGIIEFHRTSMEQGFIYKENEVFDECIQHICEEIHDEEERAAFWQCFNREKLLKLFDLGEHEAEMEYRRSTGMSEFMWVRTYVKLLREPDSQDVIAVAYTRNAENEKRRMTTSRMLLNQLHVATDQLYVSVIALDFNDYTYDVIQENHAVSPIRQVRGSIQELVNLLYPSYHPDSYDFLETIRSLPNMMGRFVGRNELLYEVKVLSEGVEKWYQHKIMPVPGEKGKQPYYLIMTQDITKNKLSEEHLKKALTEAKAAGKAKQDFMAHMSHEMRTPLNGIKGILDIMHDRPELENDKMLGDAINSVNHLSGLINDVLDMAKIESGNIALKRNIFSIAELGEYINSIILPMAESRNITYVCENDWCSFPYIYADKGRMRQILINLLTNAVKYTQPGGRVTFQCTFRPLEINRIRLQMVIEDNGIGMSREVLKRAFIPFERAEEAIAYADGTGLGLPITKRLVDLMNGRIDIESELDRGTKVTVQFDTDLVDEDSESFRRYRQCMNESGNELERLKGKHVLLVEDNVVNMEIAEYNIRAMCMTCDQAYDGEDALKMYLEHPAGYYDIIFTDIMMPKKDGLTLARDIRSSNKEDAGAIAIVAMTANAFTEDIEKSMESGMNYHLSKPFDINDVRGILVKEFSK